MGSGGVSVRNPILEGGIGSHELRRFKTAVQDSSRDASRSGASEGRIFTDLHVFQGVLLADASEHVLLAALLHFAGKQQLVQDVVGLGEGEDDVELADVSVVLVHLLNVAVDDFEGDEFIVVGGAAGDEEERGVAAVDDLGVLVFKEVAHASASGQDRLGDVLDNLCLFLGRQGGEPFGKTLERRCQVRVFGSCLGEEAADAVVSSLGVTYDLALSRQQNQVVNRHGGDTITR